MQREVTTRARKEKREKGRGKDYKPFIPPSSMKGIWDSFLNTKREPYYWRNIDEQVNEGKTKHRTGSIHIHTSQIRPPERI